MKSTHKPIRSFVIAVITIAILGVLSSCGKVPAKSTKTSSATHITSETSSDASETSSISGPEAYAAYSDVLNSFRKYVNTVVDENDLDSYHDSFDMSNDHQTTQAGTAWGGVLNGLRQLRMDTGLPYPEYNKLPLGEVLKQTLGYAIKDINGDGIPEMVILSKKYRVIGVFTLVDKKPYLLDGYWDRYRCAIDASGLLYIVGSGGAYYTNWKVQQLAKRNGKLILVAAFGIDGTEGKSDKPRYYKMIDGHKTIINESEFKAFTKKHPAFAGTFDDAAAQAVTKNSGLEFVPLFK